MELVERVEVSRLEGAFRPLIMKRGEEEQSGVKVPLIGQDDVVFPRIIPMLIMWSW